MARQDSSFYTNKEGAEMVWQEEGNEFYVVRNGEMRINYGDRVMRYTSDLEEAGIDTDQKLLDLHEAEAIEFINNSCFEVWSSQDTEYFSIMLKVKRQVEAQGRSLDLVEFFEHKLKLWRHFEEFCADSSPTVTWDVRRRVWVLTDGAHRTCLGASRGRTSFEFAMHLWT